MHRCNRLMEQVMACLLAVAMLVASPAVVLADFHQAMPQASCATAGDSSACAAGDARASATADSRHCDGGSTVDRHCCAAPLCLSAHGTLMPDGVPMPTGLGVPVEPSAIADRLVGTEPGPGMRPPKPLA